MFFSFLAKSAMNGCFVAVFFSLVLGSSVRKTSGRLSRDWLSRDCLEEYQGRIPKRFCDQLTFSIIQVVNTFPGISQNLPENVSIFLAKMINLCLLTQKTKHFFNYLQDPDSSHTRVNFVVCWWLGYLHSADQWSRRRCTSSAPKKKQRIHGWREGRKSSSKGGPKCGLDPGTPSG